MEQAEVILFYAFRHVQQLHGNLHRGVGLYFPVIPDDGDVQGLGVGDLAVVYVQGLGGAGGVGVSRLASQLGHLQLRAGGDAGLGAVADFHAIGVARGVHIEGADCVCNHIH